MGQEMADGDAARVRGQRGKPAPDGIVVGDALALGQDLDRGRSELLGDRSEAKVGARRDGDTRLEIGHPIATLEDDRPVANDRHGRPGNVAGVLAHQPVDRTRLSHSRALMLRRTGESDEREQQDGFVHAADCTGALSERDRSGFADLTTANAGRGPDLILPNPSKSRIVESSVCGVYAPRHVWSRN